jgi:tRNA modification GTPase
MSPLAGDRERGGDVLVAPATPPGVSALAVVRLTGPAGETRRVARRLAPELPEEPEPRRALLLDLVDAEGRALDRAVVLFWAAPHSPTGEEVVELVCHGSPGVVTGLLEAAVDSGARPAARGEFTRRALKNGKLDLAAAEGLAALARAESRGAVRRALGLVDGALSWRVAAARERTLDALAALEASLDFAEDVAPAEATRAGVKLGAVAEDLRALAAGARESGERRPVVAILGRPNAGKSTLFNALLGRDRAIVTDVPGTTRDAISETLEVAGESVTLLDTAGLRETADAVERIGVDVAARAGESADLVLYVIDAQIGKCEEDEDLLRRGRGESTLQVWTKTDLLSGLSSDVSGNLEVSAKTGAGLEALRAVIAARLGFVEAEGEVLVLARHGEALAEAARLLGAAARLARDGPELAAGRAREALVALGAITGETATEDLLDRVFAAFCVGK